MPKGEPVAIINDALARTLWPGQIRLDKYSTRMADGASSVWSWADKVVMIAEARTPLSPAGTVFFQGEDWNAESEAPVEKGRKVRVLSVEGLKLHVSPVSK